MLPGEHDVDDDAQGVDIRADVRLRNAVLLRGGKAGGSQHLCIGIAFGFINSGSVKLDQYGVGASENNIFRFDVAMNGAQGMNRPQRAADLHGDFSRFLRRKQCVF